MANEAKPGQYTKRPAGAQVYRPVELYQCAMCEYHSTDEGEMREHVRNPGLHKSGTPKLITAEAEAVTIKEPATPGASNPEPLTEEEQERVTELQELSGDELEQMAVDQGVAKSGTKEQVATRLVIAGRSA